jgi:hypothetical protein
MSGLRLLPVAPGNDEDGSKAPSVRDFAGADLGAAESTLHFHKAQAPISAASARTPTK